MKAPISFILIYLHLYVHIKYQTQRKNIVFTPAELVSQCTLCEAHMVKYKDWAAINILLIIFSTICTEKSAAIPNIPDWSRQLVEA